MIPRLTGLARRLPGVCAGALAAALTLGSLPPAQALEMANLKAAIVYNLLLFAEWPPEALAADAATLTLCIDAAGAGTDPMRLLAARPVGLRKLEVRGVGGTPEALRGCNAWYHDAAVVVPPGTALRRQLQQSAVLVISDDTRREDDGTAIYLVESNGRLSFDVDATTVRQFRLQLSSKLLRLARKVYE